MAYYRINGGKRLEGAVTISGAKNAALAIIPAVILSGESCLLENLPEIEDVRIVEEILTSMGAAISRTPDGSMRIDPSGINTFSVTGEMVRPHTIFAGRCWAGTKRRRSPSPAAAP